MCSVPRTCVTPRSNTRPPRLANSVTGIASSTSLASITPSKSVGGDSSQRTGWSASRPRWRSRRSGDRSMIAYSSTRNAELAQAGQQIAREHAAAGAELEQARRTAFEQRRDLARQRLREQRRQLRRRDEVAAARGGAELRRTRGVVAETRRVKRELHQPVEWQPTARGVDRGDDRRLHLRAVRDAGRRQAPAGSKVASAAMLRAASGCAVLRDPSVDCGAFHPTSMPASPVALVTGGARRIGRAIALGLAARRLGRRRALPPLEARRAGHRGRRSKRWAGARSRCSATSPTKRAVRGLLRARQRGARPGGLRGQQRLAVRVRRCAPTSRRALLARPHAGQPRRADAAGAGAACAPLPRGSAGAW